MTNSLPRSTGVIVLAWLCFLITLEMLVTGFLLLGVGSFLPQTSSLLMGLLALVTSCGSHLLAALMLFLQLPVALYAGVYFLIALLYVAIGIGLLKMHNWARRLVIVLIVIELVTTAAGYSLPRFLLLRQGIIAIATDVVALVFLLRPATRKMFGVREN